MEHYKYIPFSMGPRTCPGYSFGKLAANTANTNKHRNAATNNAPRLLRSICSSGESYEIARVRDNL